MTSLPKWKLFYLLIILSIFRYKLISLTSRIATKTEIGSFVPIIQRSHSQFYVPVRMLYVLFPMIYKPVSTFYVPKSSTMCLFLRLCSKSEFLCVYVPNSTSQWIVQIKKYSETIVLSKLIQYQALFLFSILKS
jgi:hypothetical protein